MKKLLILLTLCGSITAANAQTEKGSLMVGGDIGNASVSLAKYNSPSYGIGINPTIGYFFSKNFVLGAGVGLAVSRSGGFTTINAGISPFVRYYFSSKSKGQFFIAGELGLNGYKTLNYHGEDNHGYFSAYGIGPGYTYFVTPNVGLEANLQVYVLNDHLSIPGSVITPNLNFGFQIYFPKKKVSTQ